MSIVLQEWNTSHIEIIAKILRLWNIHTYETNHYFTGTVLLSVWIRTAYNYNDNHEILIQLSSNFTLCDPDQRLTIDANSKPHDRIRRSLISSYGHVHYVNFEGASLSFHQWLHNETSM